MNANLSTMFLPSTQVSPGNDTSNSTSIMLSASLHLGQTNYSKPLDTTISQMVTPNVSVILIGPNSTLTPVREIQDHPVYLQVLIGILFTMLSLVTIGGNLLVFVAFYKNVRLRTITNYFILSLATSDLLIGIFSINFYGSFIITNKWYLGAVICDAWLCMDYTCCQASVFNLVTICIDRYLSLTRPLSYRAKRTESKAKIVIAIIWIVSFLEWSPMIVGYQFIQGQRTVPDDNCYIQFLTENAYLTFGTALLAFYLPITVMAVLYFKIYLLTKKREDALLHLTSTTRKIRKIKTLNKMPHFRNKASNIPKSSQYASGSTCTVDGISLRGTCRRLVTILQPSRLYKLVGMTRSRTYEVAKQPKRESLQRFNQNGVQFKGMTIKVQDDQNSVIGEELDPYRKCASHVTVTSGHKKAAKMLSIILLAYFITWLPYDIFAIMMPFCPLCIPSGWWAFGYSFCYFNSTVNPFCYALGNKTFKDAFKVILFKQGNKDRSSISVMTSTNTTSSNPYFVHPSSKSSKVSNH